MRFCVYTSLIGDYENLNEQPVAKRSEVPFFCFTDRADRKSSSWTIRPVTPAFELDPARSQRNVKIRPHLILPDYDLSLYIDNSVILKKTPEEIVATVLSDEQAQIALFEHSLRNSVLEELKTVYERGIDDPWRLLEFEKHLRAHKSNILDRKPFWGGFILRRHMQPACIEFAEIWYAHVLRYCRRDQLSLNLALEKSGVRLQPIRLPNAESEFHFWPHSPGRNQNARGFRYDPPGDFPGLDAELRETSRAAREAEIFQARQEARHARAEADALQQTLARFQNSASWKVSQSYRAAIRAIRWTFRSMTNPGFSRPRKPEEIPPPPPTVDLEAEARKFNLSRGDKRDIVFLVHPDRLDHGSTVLRGRQLCELVASQMSDRRVRLSETADIADSVVILSKGALEFGSVEQLEALAKTNTLVADFVDLRETGEMVGIVDALMAASVSACRAYLEHYPGKPVFHVTHHVDLRIPRNVAPPKDEFRAGYFGMPYNALLGPEIERRITVNLADTGVQDPAWIRDLEKFNFHYGVRQRTDFDGHKPFLKGFIAANCRSNMIIQRAEAEALYYLGEDYPYLLPEPFTPAVVLQMLDYARESFAGPEWAFGLQIMRDIRHRSSLEHVIGEFRQMIASL